MTNVKEWFYIYNHGVTPDFWSISGGNFGLKVERDDGSLVRGSIAPTASANVIRWQIGEGGALSPGGYKVILAGDQGVGIKSSQGSPLDGEPTQLPSGDGTPGGDFVFKLEVIQE